MKGILFITSHNLATNPRLVKEIELAVKEKMPVQVLCFEFEGWSKMLNDAIVQRLAPHINIYMISAGRTPKIPWLKSTVKSKVSFLLSYLLPKKVGNISQYLYKRSILLQEFLQKNKPAASLIIAHNPGAFYPAKQYAASQSIPYAIDLEDYHAGESNNIAVNKRIKKLLKSAIDNAVYLSAASPLIKQYTVSDTGIQYEKLFVVQNYFAHEDFVNPVAVQNDKLQLIWFSQHINADRGLENVLPFISCNPEKFELHLYGNADETFIKNVVKDAENIFVFPAQPQVQLHNFLSRYDVGLALEDKNANMNKNLALSNKMLAYQQAGLYILASNTAAQHLFIESNPQAGSLAELTPLAMAQALNLLYEMKGKLRSEKKLRFDLARSTCWESESIPLLNKWKQILQKEDQN